MNKKLFELSPRFFWNAVSDELSRGSATREDPDAIESAGPKPREGTALGRGGMLGRIPLPPGPGGPNDGFIPGGSEPGITGPLIPGIIPGGIEPRGGTDARTRILPVSPSSPSRTCRRPLCPGGKAGNPDCDIAGAPGIETPGTNMPGGTLGRVPD
jgi:hypothetical protein